MQKPAPKAKEEVVAKPAKPERKKEVKKQAIEESVDAGRIAKFEQMVQESLVKASERDSLSSKIDFTAEELQTKLPSKTFLKLLITHASACEEAEIMDLIKSYKPVFEFLIERANTRRFKLQLLFLVQAIIFDLGLPRMSPVTALVEALFDSLYFSEIIEEQYFDWWAEDDEDETAGKMQVMFQLNFWLDWLRNAKLDGEETEEEEEDSDEDASSDEDDYGPESYNPKR